VQHQSYTNRERLPSALPVFSNYQRLPLYPEARQCKAPTADKILALFDHQRRHRLFDADRHLRTFSDPLNDIQCTVLRLLEIPTEKFGA
jgi:hypothetical protein